MLKKKLQKRKHIFIIEHLEPKLFNWCKWEYENISKILNSGKNKNLWFTNVKNEGDRLKLKRFGRVLKESVRKTDINSKDSCILDPEASRTLNFKDSGRFKYFIFGGILGDFPPKKRTRKELTRFLNCEKRNIGKEQMSTDNAIFTVKKIVNGAKFSDLKFKDSLNIEVNEFESINLPYRYNLIRQKPLISEKVIKYLKKKKSF